MSNCLVRKFILWARRRTPYVGRVRVTTFTGEPQFRRYHFLWPDEYVTQGGTHFNTPPWYRPYNILLHLWQYSTNVVEGFHDHPRWSITICLRGQIIERTPWGERRLKAGSVVFRSHKAIHSFEIPKGYSGKTWTLFIVGKRNHPQNQFIVTRY